MITFNELLERVKTEKILVHTPTEEQAKTLLKALDEEGYEWCDGEKLTTETHYKIYKENTCYNFGADTNQKLFYKKVCVSPLDWYQRHGYTIIDFTDIDFKENK